MEQDLYTFILNSIPMIFFISIALFFTVFSIKGLAREIKAKHNSIKVKAKVIDIIDRGIYHDMVGGLDWQEYQEVYEITLNGNKYTIKSGSIFREGHRPIGAEVTVRVNPNNLSETIESTRWIIAWTFLTTMAIVVTITFILCWIFII